MKGFFFVGGEGEVGPFGGTGGKTYVQKENTALDFLHTPPPRPHYLVSGNMTENC